VTYHLLIVWYFNTIKMHVTQHISWVNSLNNERLIALSIMFKVHYGLT